MPVEETEGQSTPLAMEANNGAEPRPFQRHLVARMPWPNGLLSWLTLILATILYILTIFYAWRSDLVSRNELFGGSPAKALQILNILSWFSNPLLGLAIAQAWDLTRAMLTARDRNGLCLLDSLALQPGTGIDGLLEIIWRARRLRKFKPGAWSIFRLISMAIVPILGIVLLSDVEAVPAFYQETTDPVALGYGIGPFNASLAQLLQPITDSSFGTRFKQFLTDSELVVDISSAQDRAGCYSGQLNDPLGPCRAKYFVPGGIEQFAPNLLGAHNFPSTSDIQPVLAKNLHGYHLEYETSNSTMFNEQTECARFGYSLASYQLCLKDIEPQKIAAFLRTCPKSLALTLGCLSNKTWPSDEGWGTTLEVYSRPADVAYNGLNGTILWYQFPNDTLTPVNVTAVELLQVFQVLFNTSNVTTPYGKLLNVIGLASNKPTEPFTIWQYFEGLVDLAKNDNDTRANTRAEVGLQSLLAIPIYHCQAKDYAELRKLLLGQLNTTDSFGQQLISQFPNVDPDTAIYSALLRYNLRVGRGSLLAYIVLAGCTLLLCAFTNGLRSCTEAGRECRNLGAFPLLTHICDYKTVGPNNRNVSSASFRRLDSKERLEKAVDFQVKLVRGGASQRNDINMTALTPGGRELRTERNLETRDEARRPRTS